MTFANPLHQLPLRTSMRVLGAALTDWAILQSDPTGMVLPSWRLRSLQQDVSRIQQFTLQNKYQQFQCYHDTVKWYGVLWSWSHQYQTMFQSSCLLQAGSYLDSIQLISRYHRYPYTQAQAWHHPTDTATIPIIGWITERMINQDAHAAELFVKHLAIHWLSRYTLEELPTNSYDSSRDVHKLRGYVLFCIAMDFEHRQVNTPEECEQL